jgi:hypothetical protein
MRPPGFLEHDLKKGKPAFEGGLGLGRAPSDQFWKKDKKGSDPT